MVGPHGGFVEAMLEYMAMGVLATLSGFAGAAYAARHGSWAPMALVGASGVLWFIGGNRMGTGKVTTRRKIWFAAAGAPAAALLALAPLAGMPWPASVVPALCSAGCMVCWAKKEEF